MGLRATLCSKPKSKKIGLFNLLATRNRNKLVFLKQCKGAEKKHQINLVIFGSSFDRADSSSLGIFDSLAMKSDH